MTILTLPAVALGMFPRVSLKLARGLGNINAKKWLGQHKPFAALFPTHYIQGEPKKGDLY
uniref:Uncharacterized protein n=1 Tax=Romanomermis culicivorax TaxID=13658 RepID=A0A915L210_ROMCU